MSKIMEIATAVALTVNMALGAAHPLNFWIAVVCLTGLIFSIVMRPGPTATRLTTRGLDFIGAYIVGPGKEPTYDTDALLQTAAWLDKLDVIVDEAMPDLYKRPGAPNPRGVQERLRLIAFALNQRSLLTTMLPYDPDDDSTKTPERGYGAPEGGIEQYQSEDR